jgi:hypothetical protein
MAKHNHHGAWACGISSSNIQEDQIKNAEFAATRMDMHSPHSIALSVTLHIQGTLNERKDMNPTQVF